jgi:hypothetical protein
VLRIAGSMLPSTGPVLRSAGPVLRSPDTMLRSADPVLRSVGPMLASARPSWKNHFWHSFESSLNPSHENHRPRCISRLGSHSDG